MRIGVLHGPNLNLLGRRDPATYGTLPLAEIDSLLKKRAGRQGVELIAFQSNSEGALIDWIHERMGEVAGWIVNPAALGHTSYALRDALEASGKPFVEVHLSNVYGREPFRRRSVLADLALGVVAGFGSGSYVAALDALMGYLSARGGEDAV